MSYDLNIWSRQKVETAKKEIELGEYTISIDDSVIVENEDIPIHIMLSHSEIRYLTSIHLQPFTNEKIITHKAINCAVKIANEVDGIVENPQCDSKILLRDNSKVFKQTIPEAGKISICWYISSDQSLAKSISEFIELLEKYLPQALPRRYGSFEPPQFNYSQTGKEHLISFLCSEHQPIIYSTKPINYIFLSDAYIDNQKYNVKDYRCNRIEIELSKEAYSEQNWQYAIKRLFREVAKLYKPFYAEIIDEKQSKICSWWWRGIPSKRGNPIIIGEPYSTLCGKLPNENIIGPGLYYFEDKAKTIKIPRNLISYKKLFASNKRGAGFFADNFKYAKMFPFK